MGYLSTVPDLLRASSQSTHRGDGREAPAGASRCDDCGDRLPGTGVDTTPDCLDCGEPMTVKRSPGRAC